MTTRPDFLCPHCSEPLHRPAGHAELSVRCPECGANVEVPEYGLSHLKVPGEPLPSPADSSWQLEAISLDTWPPHPEQAAPPAPPGGAPLPPRAPAPSPTPATTAAPPIPPPPVHAGAAAPRSHRGLLSVLLLSYALALTWIALWLWWSRPTGLEHLPDRGNRAAETEIVDPATPIPNGQFVKLGRSITLGELQVEPLEVGRGRVVLERHTEKGEIEQQTAKSESLILRVRFTNRSKDQAFYPLDESLLRGPFKYSYTYIERSDGAKIKMYPLALESDFQIRGERLIRLEPEQSVETSVAADEGSAGLARGAMVWRLHVRTAAKVRPGGGLSRLTTVVGVPFDAGQVQPLGPAPPENDGNKIPRVGLPTERIAKLGQTLEVGPLAVTAVGVEQGAPTLGWKDAVRNRVVESLSAEKPLAILRLRLKNRTENPLSIPLLDKFDDDPDSETATSFIQTAGPGRIPTYGPGRAEPPGIVGGTRLDLEPGKASEVLIPAREGSAAELRGDSTWIVALPLEAGESEKIGVQFGASAVGTFRPPTGK